MKRFEVYMIFALLWLILAGQKELGSFSWYFDMAVAVIYAISSLIFKNEKL